MAIGVVRKRGHWTRSRAKRSRPKTPAPKTGWLIAELSRISQLSVGTIRYYVRRGLVTPSEFRGNLTRYQRRELLRLLSIPRLQYEARKSLSEIKQILDRLGENEILAWLLERPLLPEAAAALGVASTGASGGVASGAGAFGVGASGVGAFGAGAFGAGAFGAGASGAGASGAGAFGVGAFGAGVPVALGVAPAAQGSGAGTVPDGFSATTNESSGLSLATTWHRVTLLPGLELQCSSTASPAVRRAAQKIFDEYVSK